MGEGPSVYVHIVAHNHEASIAAALDAVLAQSDFEVNKNLFVNLTDNNSQDETKKTASQYVARGVNLFELKVNAGFALGHNIALRRFIDSDCAYFLCLNPDLALKRDALSFLCAALMRDPSAGSACPKLLRAKPDLSPVEPPLIDAAGMYITPSIRHFDRGAGESDRGQYDGDCYVFGGSGACLLMSKEYVRDVVMPEGGFTGKLIEIYPAYAGLISDSACCFDDAFFAYREDADLAWRSQLLGWNCLYVSSAVGYHVRRVTPERRSILPAEINRLGVKNRFLLQLNNYRFAYGIGVFLKGYCLRNLLVILAALIKERSSLAAFRDIARLFRRGLHRRAVLAKRTRRPYTAVRYWFFNRSKELGQTS